MSKSAIFGAFFVSFLSGFLLLATADAAYAVGADSVLENMVTTSDRLPSLIAAIAYMLGLILGVSGILKLKEHVENPQQTPLRTPMIRLLVGGGMFALPIVYETMKNAFDAGFPTNFNAGATASSFVWGLLARFASFPFFSLSLPSINGILYEITQQIKYAPLFIAALAYVLGLIFGIGGLIKLKDHVENPDQTRMKEPVIRFFVAGAFFALPTIYQAMHDLVNGPGIIGQISSAIAAAGLVFSEYDILSGGLIGCMAGGIGDLIGGGGTTLGTSLCGALLGVAAFPAFLTALSYIIGMILGFFAILKIKDHVENPQQTSVWEGFSRLIAGGFFLALPYTVEIIRSTTMPLLGEGLRMFQALSTFNETSGGGCDGLDGMMRCMMVDLLMPVHLVLNLFTLIAGMILIMIGISRLTKSAQDGPRGPGGIGTLLTFIVGGALLSYNELIRVFTFTLFPTTGGTSSVHGVMQYTEGMNAAELQHAHNVISAVVRFMILVGLISFVRGLFIVRDVAEGNGQASLMAGMTHLVGGALAVNLGPLINVVQATLGITDYGIRFDGPLGGGIIPDIIGGLFGP